MNSFLKVNDRYMFFRLVNRSADKIVQETMPSNWTLDLFLQ